MGNANQKEALYNAINADDCALTTQIIKNCPEILNEPITTENETTPLGRAAWRGNVEMIYTLIELGADVNFVGPQSISPLQWASQRGKDEAVDFLIQKKAKLDFVSRENLNALDYAVLFGAYNTARKLINLGLELKNAEFYEASAKQKHIPYYDYKMMLEHLEAKIPLEECPPFHIPPPEKKFKDPVIDPRETWTQFAKRIVEFDDPPLVERDSLPQDLRPENRLLGKLRSYVNGQSPFPKNDAPADLEIAEVNNNKPEESVVLTSEEAKHDEDDDRASKAYKNAVDGKSGRDTESNSSYTKTKNSDINNSSDILVKAGPTQLEPAQIEITTKKSQN